MDDTILVLPYLIIPFRRNPILPTGTASPRPNTAPPRVKSEAEATATLGRGPRMKIIVNEYARKKPTPRQPRVKPEAEGTAEVSKVS